jgi:hypothetical protein
MICIGDSRHKQQQLIRRDLYMRRILSRIPLTVVLGLMIICYPVTRSAAGQRVLACELEAYYNLMPRVVIPGKREVESRFLLGGKCRFPTSGYSVELRPHIPPSSDPKILLLDAIVHAPTNAVPQVPTDELVRFLLPESPYAGILYEKVIILPDKLVLPVGQVW